MEEKIEKKREGREKEGVEKRVKKRENRKAKINRHMLIRFIYTQK